MVDEINGTSGPPLLPFQWCQNGLFLLLCIFIVALGRWRFIVPIYFVQDCRFEGFRTFLHVFLSTVEVFVRWELFKGAQSRLNGLKSLAKLFNFVVCNPCQSCPSLTILVPLLFIIVSLMFFYLYTVLFSGFLQFNGNFVDAQNNSKYRDWAPLSKCMSHLVLYK